MMNEIVEHVKTLSDTQLLDGLQNAMRTECRSTATLVAHIAEVDARRLYLEHAKPSMFSYCVDALGLSEQAAYLRINAARLTRRFPKALDGLAAGRLHLTALKLVGPHLTDENSGAVLERVGGKSRRAIEVELARLFPREDAPSQLRKLPTERGEECEVRDDHPSSGLFGDSNTPQVQTTAPASASERPGSEPSASASVPPFKPHRPSDVSRCTALSGSRYRLQVTLPENTRAKLDAARDLLRHQVSDGDLASVLDHALDALIEVRMKRKFAKTSRPRRDGRHSTSKSRSGSGLRSRSGSESRFGPEFESGSPAEQEQFTSGVGSEAQAGLESKSTTTRASQIDAFDSGQLTPVVSHADVRGRAGPRSRHIPNAIKRAVVDRDGMRCSYVDEQGERCTATSPLEFHHHDPFAKGGAHSVSNVSLVCRAHNGHAARRDYGRMMERYQKPPGRVRERRAHYRVHQSLDGYVEREA